jgi:hypothetical protein
MSLQRKIERRGDRLVAQKKKSRPRARPKR